MIKQFVPSEYCLKCQGCCRFRDQDSVWAPCLLEEEIEGLIDKDLPAAYLTMDKRIRPFPNPKGEDFICAFLSIEDNKCRVYENRPFECQLYPFLITMRDKKVILTVDLNCPYVKEKIKAIEFKDYLDYLTAFFNQPAQLELLKDNPHIMQAYEEVLDVMELDLPDDETK